MEDKTNVSPSQSNPPTEQPSQSSNNVALSSYTVALLNSINSIKHRASPDEITKLSVSQTVSFLALVYEKMRNAVEYREDHLVRRAAIERILRRRLALNPDGKDQAEDILRELMWARYFPNGSLDENDIHTIQKIIDKYLSLRNQIINGRQSQQKQYLNDFLLQLLTCEIEETLSPDITAIYSSFTYFIFQTLREKVKIEGLSADQKDAFFLVAIEKTYRKSDISYERYHLFTTFYKPLSQQSQSDLQAITTKLPDIFKKIDEMIVNPYSERLQKFTRSQLPPFLILFNMIRKKPNDIKKILENKETLWAEVDAMCREKYQQTQSKIRSLAFKSLIYIFLTKMIFAIILEYPVSLWLYGEVNLVSIAINSLFPPLLMLIIVLFVRLPDEDNTKKIFQRIIEIIDKDKSFETRVALITKKTRVKRPILVFGFTVMYSLTFLVTLFLIHDILSFIHFNLVSEVLFVFFVSVVSFFSYRIRRVVKEYRLVEKESIFTPIIDFFFMPILSIGKFLSTELGRLNIFIIIFDFFIEAPFKLIIEIFEEWIKFVKARKEEIV